MPGAGTPWSIHLYRDGDISALVVLSNVQSAASGADPAITEAMLEEQYSRPGRDPHRTVVVVDGPLPEGMPDGTLIGSGRAFYIENAEAKEYAYELAFRVHPSLQHSLMEQAIARALLDLINSEEERAAAQDPEKAGRPIMLRAYTYDSNIEGKALWEWLGMRETRRWYWMYRSSSDSISEPRLLEGVSIHTYQRPANDEGVRDAALSSFADHFDFNSSNFADEWQYWDNAPTLRADLSWVAEDLDGKIVSFCIVDVGSSVSRNTGAPDALITYVGTIREWRGKGLARHLLLRTLQSLRDAGIEDVYLNVDADSPTKANTLYESVGFTTKRITFQYKCNLSDARR